ncbi:uncharacterized protein LOC128555454 [Mercenaria mercenaria]|uniref:uncharacterized protein LOC128555454 n=1 Tax=Mercenaria mercenaria TaxID=6596 RepID=UPI00234F09CE|nr:uncharacterized protein LOC128555454 [Mercenaria mercenaria]
MAKSSNINTCPLQDNRGSPNEKKEGGKKVEEQPADSRSLTALKSEITEKHQDFSRKDNVDNAASIGKLVECNEHKADDKDKDDLKDKKENMQPTDLVSVTHEGSIQKTAEDKGGTKHDDSAGHENGSKDSKTSGKPKVEAASADTCVNKVEPSDESIEKDDDYPRHFKNNLSDVEEKTEEHLGEESQRTDDDTQPESGSPLSRSSSIENIAEEDQGENVDESYCSVQFEMKSYTLSQNDCRKELKYDTESDKQNGKALTDVFNKAKTQDIEDEDENRQDTHRFNNKESGKSEPIEDSSVPYRYTLREVDNEYVLLVNNTIPVKVPELNGKSNVSVKEDFIRINGKLEYLIKNEGGKIILTKLEEAQVGDVSKEIQKLSPSPVARHDHGEEEITSDSKVRTAMATKIRASTPQMDELMKTEDDEKSQTDKCSQPVASINTDDSHNISVEGEEKDLEMVTNLMRGVKIEGLSENALFLKKIIT